MPCILRVSLDRNIIDKACNQVSKKEFKPCHRLYLDGKLLHVLVVLHIVCNGLLNDLGSFLAVLLGPLGVKLLFALLSLLLCRLSAIVLYGL